MTQAELKLCAHCGLEGNPWLLTEEGTGCFSVGCSVCGVTTIYFATEAEAVAAWNRRADGWVSVEMRLPEGFGPLSEVLIATPIDTGGFSTWMGWRDRDCYNGWWSDDPDWDSRETITHWRPLPPPPAPPEAE